MRYYNGALNLSQIQASMASAIVTQTTLVAGINAGSGPTASDQSGPGGNTLALTNTTWTVQGHTSGALQFNSTTSRAELPTPATDLAFTTAFTLGMVNATTLEADGTSLRRGRLAPAAPMHGSSVTTPLRWTLPQVPPCSLSALVAGQWLTSLE